MDDQKVPVTIYLDQELKKILETVARQQKREQKEVIVDSLRRYLHLKMFEILREQSLPFDTHWVEHLKSRLKQIHKDKNESQSE